MRMRTLTLAVVLTLGASSAFGGPLLWVHDLEGDLGTVDVDTGLATVIGRMSPVMTDIAFSPGGVLYAISGLGTIESSLYTVNTATAAATFVGETNTVISGNALVFGADGTLYMTAYQNTKLFTLNPATGAATEVGPVSASFSSGGDLAFLGGTLYAISTSNRLWSLNPATGAGVEIGPTGVSNMYGLASIGGTLYGVAGTKLYTVNTATGVATFSKDFVQAGGDAGDLGQAYGQSFPGEAVPVPEPASLLLLGAGLLAAARSRRCQRRN